VKPLAAVLQLNQYLRQLSQQTTQLLLALVVQAVMAGLNL
jgi:hypothetical protein